MIREATRILWLDLAATLADHIARHMPGPLSRWVTR